MLAATVPKIEFLPIRIQRFAYTFKYCMFITPKNSYRVQNLIEYYQSGYDLEIHKRTIQLVQSKALVKSYSR